MNLTYRLRHNIKILFIYRHINIKLILNIIKNNFEINKLDITITLDRIRPDPNSRRVRQGL